MRLIHAALATMATLASATTHLDMSFDAQDALAAWTQSTHRDDYGKVSVVVPKFGTAKGIKTMEDARHYAVSTAFDKPIDNSDKPLVIQFSVKHEQSLDCGGGYFKFFAPEIDAKTMHGGVDETPYNIMFGPDICGSTRKTQVILNYKGKNHLTKRDIYPMSDEVSHLYTLILIPDKTYKVLIDNEEKGAGSLLEDWDFLPPKTIKDPDAKKPEDWDELEMIADPDEKKPDEWDDIQEFVADPDAKQPEDWDEDMDGEWEAPKVNNADFKGKWAAKQIKNPAYKGLWVHPEIPNPDFKKDDSIGQYITGHIGLEVWQVKAGTIFSHILVTDDVEEASTAAKKFLEYAKIELEAKTAHDAIEQKIAEEASKKTQEAAAAAEAASGAKKDGSSNEETAEELGDTKSNEETADELGDTKSNDDGSDTNDGDDDNDNDNVDEAAHVDREEL